MILHGDCINKIKELDDNSVDAIVTDPPYELGFMGKKWDASGIAHQLIQKELFVAEQKSKTKKKNEDA